MGEIFASAFMIARREIPSIKNGTWLSIPRRQKCVKNANQQGQTLGTPDEPWQ